MFTSILPLTDYMCQVNSRDITTGMDYTEEPDPPCSLEFLEMDHDMMNVHHFSFPDTISTALDLYVNVTTMLENSLVMKMYH